MKQNWLMMWSGSVVVRKLYYYILFNENVILYVQQREMAHGSTPVSWNTNSGALVLGWAASTSQLQRYNSEYCQKHSIEWNSVDPKMKCWPRSVMCSWWQINILCFIYFLWNHSVRHCYLWTKSSKVTCWLKSISEVGRLDCATISNRLLTT